MGVIFENQINSLDIKYQICVEFDVIKDFWCMTNAIELDIGLYQT